MKSETIQELMMFLCTSRFDLEVQEVKELERVFSFEEIEALREEKNEKPDDLEIDMISDTKEQANIPDNLSEVDNMDDDTGDKNHGTEPQLLESSTQLRTSGRKRKTIEDDLYERYQWIDNQENDESHDYYLILSKKDQDCKRITENYYSNAH